MKRTSVILALILSGIAVYSGGCILLAAGAGAGTVAYVRGDLEATYDANIDKVYNATLKSMGELELTPTQKQKDALTALVVARTSADKKVTIKLTRVGESLTKITIRIGVFGDEVLSRAIFERIKGNL